MIDFRVIPDGGEALEFTATARDVLVWEKTNKGKAFSQLVSGQNMQDLYKIAHIAARRLGLFTGDLPTFEQTCDLVLTDDETKGTGELGDMDPTRPAP